MGLLTPYLLQLNSFELFALRSSWDAKTSSLYPPMHLTPQEQPREAFTAFSFSITVSVILCMGFSVSVVNLLFCKPFVWVVMSHGAVNCDIQIQYISRYTG